MRRTIIGLILILCLGACAPGHNDYSGFAHIESRGWVYGHPVEFRAEIGDSIAVGEMVIALRHSNSYPYSNLWLELSTYRDDTLKRRDTMEMKLADIYGRWYGHGLGTSYQITDTLPASLALARGERIVLRHIMRTDTLAGVEQVGVMFTAHN